MAHSGSSCQKGSRQWNPGRPLRSPLFSEARVSLFRATTPVVLKWVPVPRPFWFLSRLFSQTFPSPKFILIYQKGHWFKISAFQIWLPLLLLFSLPYLWWHIPQHYDLILPSKYAIPHPDKYLGKNQLLHMHAQTRKLLLLMIHHNADCIHKARLSF